VRELCVVDGAAGPRIVERPGDQSVLEGGSATLQCRASGVPRPSVSWLKNDLDLPSAADRRLLVDDDGTLRLTELRRADSGVYRCVASNSLGSVSEFARLHVLGSVLSSLRTLHRQSQTADSAPCVDTSVREYVFYGFYHI